MKLFTRFELAARTTQDLHVLFRKVTNELTASPLNSHTRRNVLASLENIQRELAERYQPQRWHAEINHPILRMMRGVFS